MALISPGVEVTVSDESQYQPTAQGTVAYVLLATAQDKTNPSGSTATGTTLANAEKVVTVTSQRELTSLFGYPTFQQDANGDPLHNDERNEYGLLAAYSALGISNRVYVQRANVDLAQLEGTTIRPAGDAPNGTKWFDYENSAFGVFEWTSNSSFTNKTPTFITTSAELESGTKPLDSLGKIGDYAVVTVSTDNPVYYKRYDNVWTLIGSNNWQFSQPTLIGTVANPTLASNTRMVINGITINPGTTVATAANAITAGLGLSSGVIATVNSAGQLEIRVNELASASGNLSIPTGNLNIALGSTVGYTDAAEPLGLVSNAQAISSNTHSFNSPTVTFSDFRSVPAWRSTDVEGARPAGSVWFKSSAVGNGANWLVKEYSSATDTWVTQTTPMYVSDNDALFALDPAGGGAGIAAGQLYVKLNSQEEINNRDQAYFTLFEKNVSGIVTATGSTPSSPFTLTVSDSFLMEVSVPGSQTTSNATVVLTGTTSTSFVADILSANLPNISAVVESSGAVSISHLAGGTIAFTYITGIPLTTLGIIADANVQTIVAASKYRLSPWAELTYTQSDAEPYSDPADNTYWYYNTATSVDVMIHDGTGWKGYRNVSNDARGYDLTNTDPDGVILAATEPTKQSDGTTALVSGDLWLDTSDLENYPKLYRYDTTEAEWTLIDNTDQVSVDGILFEDARWGASGSVDPISDSLPTTASLLTNNYLDPDAPNYQLFARGTLLFNTRRSGYNVKRYESEWHANALVVPAQVGAWVSSSGVDEDGVPYFGHFAQRNVVVEAMKAAIVSSTDIREDQVEFNLMTAPGYPELIQNMVTLNNDRKNTAFIIGDAPLTLTSSSTVVDAWGRNTALAADNNKDSLVTRNEYLGVYYPSARTTDLSGNAVVVPASHVVLRTILRSDNASYVWFAPAGVRRGIVDNASSIGYVDVNDNNLFRSIGVSAGLRDVLYDQEVNPLTVLPGVGLVVYGQKTRASSTSAMDRVNVSRLVVYLRKVLDQIARPFIFEPNDTITRNQVKQAFEAVLNDVVAKRGITDYLVVCDTTNNTPDRIDRNELYVDIAIEPMKAVEFIYIPVRLKNTGDIATGL